MPHRFAQSNPIPCPFSRRCIQKLAGLFHASECAFTQGCVNIFRSGSNHRDLRVVDQHRAVGGDCSDKTPLHQIDDDGREARLDNVATNTPDDRLFKFTSAFYLYCKFAQALNGKDVRK